MPVVFPGLGKIRRAELTMVAGIPSAGKSLFALWHSVQWTKLHDQLGLYFSADSSELGQAARALAMSTHGVGVDEAERLLTVADEHAIEQMNELNKLQWSFENDLSYETIYEEVEAFIEMWGTTPDYIVVDNLMDVDGQDADEWATYRRVLKGLTQMARVTGSAVIVLAHTSEDPRHIGDPCPPRWAILGKCNQKPALIYTIADRGRQKPVATVKDRFGKDDRSGHVAQYLQFNPFNMHFGATA